MTGGTKHDQDKPRPELCPPTAIMAAARVFEFGARKYSANNWRQGIKFSRLYGALQRHLNAWWDGQNIDQESGDHHLAHAMCCLMMLVEHFENAEYEHLDDRAKGIQKEPTEIDDDSQADWKLQSQRARQALLEVRALAEQLKDIGIEISSQTRHPDDNHFPRSETPSHAPRNIDGP